MPPRASNSQARRPPTPDATDGEGSDDQRDGVNGQGLANLELSDPLKTCRHLFLQSLISKKVIPKEVVQQLYKDCVRLCQVQDAPDLQTFVGTIESGLNLIGFEFKETKDQETGQTLYILSNSLQDASAKIATDYNAEQIAFFKAIVAKIMLARDMSYSVSQQEAIKQAKAPITRIGGIQLIKSFLAKGWLSLHASSGRLILSTRSLFELLPYIRETFADDDDEEEQDVEPRDRVVVYCNYCTKIVTCGYACPNRHCRVRLHTYCANVTIGNSGQCPDQLTNQDNPCTQVWRKDQDSGKFVGHPVGVAALGLDDDDDDDDRNRARPVPSSDEEEEEERRTPAVKKKTGKGKAQTGGKGKGKKKKQNSDDDEDEEMEDVGDTDEDEEDEDAGSPSRSSGTRKSSRRSSAAANTKRRTIQPTSDGDEDDDE